MVEHIEYLLTCHDCVVVPGWGAFIANYNTARYNHDRQVLERPRRVVGFNASVNHNDGLLAQSIMRREGVTHDEAMRMIEDNVTVYRQQLAAGTEVSMGRLGYFMRGAAGTAQFVPFFHMNTTDQYYGLADIDIKRVAVLERERALAAQPQTEVIAEEAPAVAPTRNLFTRKAVQIAASVAVLLGMGVLLTTPVIINRDNQQQAAVVPTVTAPAVQQVVTVEDYPALASVGNTSGKYHMVIASLRNQQELQAFKDLNPKLVPYMKTLQYKGLTCVYVARSDDYNTLMNLRSELPEQYRNVWIYK